MSAPGSPSPCSTPKACRLKPPPNLPTIFRSPCCWRSTGCRRMERAAFLLHDVFDTPFSEVAAMLDRTEAACRQLASRARRAVRDERPAPAATPDNHARLLQAFGEAVTSGNVARLAELLREDAVALTDGGGRKTAALNPIIGADKIARFFIGLAAKNAGHEIRVEPAMINGAIGALLYLDGELDHTMSMAIDQARKSPRSISSAIPTSCAICRSQQRTDASAERYRIRQRLAGEKRVEIGDHAVLHRHMRLQRMAADMRGQHDVGQRRQRVRRMRLLLVHVEAGAGDGLLGQRRDQRLLVDDRAARDIDDVTVLAELVQDTGIDGMFGISPCPHRDHQDAAPFRQRIEASENIDKARRAGCG